jgi:hypothetical protein
LPVRKSLTEEKLDPAWTPVLGWMFALALTFIFVPPLALMMFRRLQGTRRRKMVNAPRKIKVLSADAPVEAQGPCAAGHERSRRNARQNSEGVYVSICRTCGAPMRRKGKGEWEVVEEVGSNRSEG